MRTFPLEVHSFAKALVDLQDARHQADYSLEGQCSKQEVFVTIDVAENAIDRFEQADARHRRAFAVYVLFKRRQP